MLDGSCYERCMAQPIRFSGNTPRSRSSLVGGVPKWARGSAKIECGTAVVIGEGQEGHYL